MSVFNLNTIIDESKTGQGHGFEEKDLSSAVTLLPSSPIHSPEDEFAVSHLPAPSEGELQAAVRLKILLGEFGGLVAVGGMGASDGFTSLTVKLGLALATMDKARVLIVDANATKPRMHEMFGGPPKAGFTDVLRETISLKTVIRRASLDNLFSLSFGSQPDSLPGLLSRPAAKRVFADLREEFRYVLIDTGVIRDGPAALLLASMSDGVVAVVAVGTRRRDEVTQFGKELKQLSIPFLGVVLTKND